MSRIIHVFFGILIIVFGAFGVSRLSFNVSLMGLLPPNLPGVAGTLAFQKFHDKPNELLLTLQTQDGGDFSAVLAERLRAEPGLVELVQNEAYWRKEPGSLVELTAHTWLNAPTERLLALEASLAPEKIDALLDKRLEKISDTFDPMTSEMISHDPLSFGSMLAGLGETAGEMNVSDGFSSADEKFHLLKVQMPQNIRGYREISNWLDRVREVVKTWQRDDIEAASVKVAYTGNPAFEAEIGSGMEQDMKQSISGITLIVGLLFWILHRRIGPLFFLMLAMLVTGLLTLGVAGIAFGTLDVMSMGFAAILMGMIEDFGVMGLHEAMRRPEANFRAVHARVFPSIAWSALASASVFAMLGLSSLPGIARMGLLTSLGILIGAGVMLYGFLPLAMRRRDAIPPASRPSSVRIGNWPGWLALVLFLLASGSLWWRGVPGNTSNTGILRPRHCKAFEALEQLQHNLQPTRTGVNWLPVIVHAKHADQLTTSLRKIERNLTNAAADGRINGHFLPSTFVPEPSRQAANMIILSRLVAARERILTSLDTAGFTAEGMLFTCGVLEQWNKWIAEPILDTRYPPFNLLENLIGPVFRRDSTGLKVCGFILFSEQDDLVNSSILDEIQQDPCVQIGGLDYLTIQLKQVLRGEVQRVLLPTVVLLIALLFLVFRNSRERLAAIAALAFSGLLLLGTMSAFGMTWNFVNIGAVPLALGLGLDFNIHMIHALRERGAEGHGVGRALAYCGLSTGLGFGALGLSDNVGLASFGQTSMIGVLATLLTAAFFLPWFWRHINIRKLFAMSGTAFQ